MDYQLYRAKIEHIEDDMDGEKTFRVRFIDYGNVSEVGAKHLHTWDPILDIIPPQATCVRLKDSHRFVSTCSPKSEEAEEFASILKRNNPFCITVKDVYRQKDEILTNSELKVPCILADLHTKSGEGIMTKLKVSKYFRDLYPETSTVSSSDKVSSSRLYSSSEKPDSGLTRTNLDLLDYKTPSKLSKVPEPLHLKEEEILNISNDESCVSPVHPLYASRAVEKVQWWLEKDESVDDETRKKFQENNRKKIHAKTIPREPELQSKTVESKRKLLANAKKSSVSAKPTRKQESSSSILNSLKIHPEIPSSSTGKEIFQFPAADIRSSTDHVNLSSNVQEAENSRSLLEDVIKGTQPEEVMLEVKELESDSKDEVLPEDKAVSYCNDNYSPSQYRPQTIEVSLMLRVRKAYKCRNFSMVLGVLFKVPFIFVSKIFCIVIVFIIRNFQACLLVFYGFYNYILFLSA